MTDLTKHYRYQRILIEAAQYRTLRQVLKADPEVTPAPLLFCAIF
jgi:hypothetical protein